MEYQIFLLIGLSIIAALILSGVFYWLAERNADREIKKHDRKVAEKLKRRYY